MSKLDELIQEINLELLETGIRLRRIEDSHSGVTIRGYWAWNFEAEALNHPEVLIGQADQLKDEFYSTLNKITIALIKERKK